MYKKLGCIKNRSCKLWSCSEGDERREKRGRKGGKKGEKKKKIQKYKKYYKYFMKGSGKPEIFRLPSPEKNSNWQKTNQNSASVENYSWIWRKKLKSTKNTINILWRDSGKPDLATGWRQHPPDAMGI